MRNRASPLEFPSCIPEILRTVWKYLKVFLPFKIPRSKNGLNDVKNSSNSRILSKRRIYPSSAGEHCSMWQMPLQAKRMLALNRYRIKGSFIHLICRALFMMIESRLHENVWKRSFDSGNSIECLQQIEEAEKWFTQTSTNHFNVLMITIKCSIWKRQI